MTNTLKWMAVAGAALILGACTDQNREAAQRPQESERSTATSGTGNTGGGEAAGSTASSPSARGSGAAGAGETGASSAMGQEKTVTGSVVSASEDELVLKPEGQDDELKLKVDSSTQVMMGGSQASVSELKEGTQVRASYDESQKVTRIEAQEASGAGTTGSTTSGSGAAGERGAGTGTSGPPGSSSSSVDTPATSPSGSGTSSGATGSGSGSGGN